jgi:hypothetical protein
MISLNLYGNNIGSEEEMVKWKGYRWLRMPDKDIDGLESD